MKERTNDPIPEFIDKKSSLSVSTEMKKIGTEIFAKNKDMEELRLIKSEKLQKISRIPLSDR